MRSKKQVVIRTYPMSYVSSGLTKLQQYLDNGYEVVMCNQFDCDYSKKGNEYILEKIEESEE